MNLMSQCEQSVDMQPARGASVDAAVQTVFDKIVTCVERGDLEGAERLRERLIEVDALALRVIVRASEIIEEARQRGVDQTFHRRWTSLLMRLTPAERTGLFHGLTRREYRTSEFIFEQGMPHSQLYFIESGFALILWRNRGCETALKKLGPGDIVASDGFFSDSVCTFSLVALGHVKLACFSRERLAGMEQDLPTLKRALYDYVKSNCDVNALVRDRDLNRRSHTRIRLDSGVAVQFLDARGNPQGRPFRGDVSDISRGGSSFLVGIVDSKLARELPGRPLSLVFKLPRTSERIAVAGTIVAVTRRADGYSLHVQFAPLLTVGDMAKVRSCARALSR